MKTNLSGCFLYINGDRIGYITNSTKFQMGLGEDKTTIIDLGGGDIDIQAVVDNSTKKGKITFEVKSNVEDIEDILKKYKIKGRVEPLDVQVVAPSPSSKQYAFSKATIINDPEIEVGPEGNFELEIESLPVKSI